MSMSWLTRSDTRTRTCAWGGSGGSEGARERQRKRKKKRDRVFPRRSGKSSAVDVENGNPVIVSSNRPRFLGSLKIFLTFISIDFQHRSQTFLFFSSSSSRRNNKIVTMNLLSLSKERERNSLVPTRSKLMYKIIMMFSIIVFFDIYIYIILGPSSPSPLLSPPPRMFLVTAMPTLHALLLI